MTRLRRAGLLSLLATLAFASSAESIAAQTPPAPSPSGLHLVLLGTNGGPIPRADRSQPASLLRIADKTYLIDAGDNVTQQIVRAGVALPALEAVFLTHLHLDHSQGLGSLMGFSWVAGRSSPLPILGPPGVEELVEREASALDIAADIFRPQFPAQPAILDLFPARPIVVDGVTEVFADDHVRVTAVANSHYDFLQGPAPAYGPNLSYSYRFDTAMGSVVFTGDTGPSEAVTALARGADVLVAEIIDLDGILLFLERQLGPEGRQAADAHMRHEHLTGEEVGRMAQAAGVKTVILTHLAMSPASDPKLFIDQVRRTYPVGDIVLGEDLDIIPIRR